MNTAIHVTSSPVAPHAQPKSTQGQLLELPLMSFGQFQLTFAIMMSFLDREFWEPLFFTEGEHTHLCMLLINGHCVRIVVPEFGGVCRVEESLNPIECRIWIVGDSVDVGDGKALITPEYQSFSMRLNHAITRALFVRGRQLAYASA